MITLPYLHIPILLVGNAATGTPGTDDYKPADEPKTVMARIMPSDIQGYNAGYHFGTIIYMHGGNVYMTEVTPEAIDHNIKLYWQKIAEMEKNEEKGTGKILTFQ